MEAPGIEAPGCSARTLRPVDLQLALIQPAASFSKGRSPIAKPNVIALMERALFDWLAGAAGQRTRELLGDAR